MIKMMIKPKIKDPERFAYTVEQKQKFNDWCKKKGYFPHTKYFEAWLAALDSNKLIGE